MDDLLDRLQHQEPRKICVIKPSSLGDIAHSLPILPALRERFPAASLTWVVNQSFRSLLDGHPALNRVIAYDRGRSGITAHGISTTLRLCRLLRAERFDLAIDLQGLLRSGLMTAATHAAVRVGPADAREAASWFYTHTVDASRLRLHAVDRVLRFASALGVSKPQPTFILPITEREVNWAREVLSSCQRPRLVMNLGARWPTKRWPPDYFAEIARRAVTEFGAGLLTVGSADDRPLTRELQHRLKSIPVRDLTGSTTLLQLAALAKEADLFLSNDTGPLHVAAAANASVIGIYTCTDPCLTGPYGPNAAAVRSCVWCAPSFQKTCGRMDCLAELTPDRVWPAVRRQLIRNLESTSTSRPQAG